MVGRPRQQRKTASRTEEGSNQGQNSFTRRNASVYDAVAGRVSTDGFIRNHVWGRTQRILAPEEVLFDSHSAPDRYEDDDLYWADRDLSPNVLPGSDLLKAIHAFAAHYYERASPNHGQGDMKSLDGTALLALGILLEETADGTLGDTGDLAFVEGQIPEQTIPETNPEDHDERGRASVKPNFVSRSISRPTAKRRRKGE